MITLLVLAASIRYGAIDFSIGEIGRAFASLLPNRAEPTLDQRIFLELRLPRAILCLLVFLLPGNYLGRLFDFSLNLWGHLWGARFI